MNFLSGHHVDRNDDLVLQLFKFLFLSGLFLGITSEKPYLFFLSASCYENRPHTAVWLLHP